MVRRRRRLAKRLTTADMPKRPKKKRSGSVAARLTGRTRHVNPRPKKTRTKAAACAAHTEDAPEKDGRGEVAARRSERRPTLLSASGSSA